MAMSKTDDVKEFVENLKSTKLWQKKENDKQVFKN